MEIFFPVSKMESVDMRGYTHLQICQFVTQDPTQSYVIAIGEERIYTDSSGKVYLYYTGPGR